MSHFHCLAALCASLAAKPCLAQTLGPLIRVNKDPATTTVTYAETAIAVNPINPNELVALAIESTGTSSGDTYFGITMDGGASFSQRTLIKTAFGAAGLPGCLDDGAGSVDPFAAASRSTGLASSNYLYFGCQRGGQLDFHGGLIMFAKAPGSLHLDAVPVECNLPPQSGVPWAYALDKSGLAIGPRADGLGGDAVYLMYNATRGDLSCNANTGLYGKVSVGTSGGFPGLNWPVTDQAFAVTLTQGIPGYTCGQFATGISPVVIPSGSNVSRLVAAYNDQGYTQSPPLVIYSTDAGHTWQKTQGPGPIGDPSLSLASEGIINEIDPLLVPPGDYLEMKNFSSTAVDPNNPDTVYVVFAGRSDVSLPYTDLYLA